MIYPEWELIWNENRNCWTKEKHFQSFRGTTELRMKRSKWRKWMISWNSAFFIFCWMQTVASTHSDSVWTFSFVAMIWFAGHNINAGRSPQTQWIHQICPNSICGGGKRCMTAAQQTPARTKRELKRLQSLENENEATYLSHSHNYGKNDSTKFGDRIEYEELTDRRTDR